MSNSFPLDARKITRTAMIVGVETDMMLRRLCYLAMYRTRKTMQQTKMIIKFFLKGDIFETLRN